MSEDNNLFVGMGQGLNFPETMRRLDHWLKEAKEADGNRIRLERALNTIATLHHLLKTRRLVTSGREF